MLGGERAALHYSGRMSERRGSTSGCSWHRYVMAHIRYIIARARMTVLLQTLCDGAMRRGDTRSRRGC